VLKRIIITVPLQADPAVAPCKPPKSASLREHLGRSGILALLLGAFSFVLYSGTLAFKFVYDDRQQVLNNAALTSWSYVAHYFTQNVWALVDSHKAANYYRPLFLLWLKLNYSLFGLTPVGWHALDILLQALVTVEVFWLARRLLKAEVPAAISALLFAVHPVHTESVAWVSGATDPLVTVFMLAAVLGFLRFLDCPTRGNWSPYAWSLTFTVLALLSKEVAVILPVVLIATAFGVRQDRADTRQIWQYALPIFLLMLAYLIIRRLVLGAVSYPLHTYSTYDVLFTLPSVLVFYGRQLLIPFWISPYANVSWQTAPDLRHFWIPFTTCCLIASAAVIGYRTSQQRPLLRALYAWSLLPLLPALYLTVLPPTELVHDRYAYGSSVGFSILIVFAGWKAAQKSPPLFGKTVAAVTLGALAIMTFSGELNWASDILLFTHAVNVSPGNDTAMMNLGVVYLENNHPEEGAAALRVVCERNPDYALAAYNLAHYLFVNHRDSEAEHFFERALTLDPTQEDWLLQFADIELRLGKISQAEQAVREAIRLRHDGPEFHLVLGAVLLAKGDRAGAEDAMSEELHLHPGDTSAREALKLLKVRPIEESGGHNQRPSATD
jgi:Flp pilus assembly protein TadD